MLSISPQRQLSLPLLLSIPPSLNLNTSSNLHLPSIFPFPFLLDQFSDHLPAVLVGLMNRSIDSLEFIPTDIHKRIGFHIELSQRIAVVLYHLFHIGFKYQLPIRLFSKRTVLLAVLLFESWEGELVVDCW